MPRGYRGIVLAVGLILPSPSYGQDGKSEQPDAGSDSASQLERIASAVEELPKAEAPDTGCQPGKDNRQSDLCAQWKAADAATESAGWTFWTLIASIGGLAIGSGTLFAAWRAAHWARQAAHHTEAGAKEARRSADEAEKAAYAAVESLGETRQANQIARTNAAFAANAVEKADEANAINREIGIAQARAYLSVAAKGMTYSKFEGLTVIFDVTNSGSSPARRAEIKLRARIYTATGKGGQIAGAGYLGVVVLGDMASGRTVEDVTFTWDLEEKHLMKLIAEPPSWLQIFAEANYKTVFADINGEDVFEYRPIFRSPTNIEFAEHGTRVLRAT